MQVRETADVYLQALEGKSTAIRTAFSAMTGCAAAQPDEALMKEYLHEPPAVRLHVSGALLSQRSNTAPESVTAQASPLRRRARRQPQHGEAPAMVELVPAGTPLCNVKLRVGSEEYRPLEQPITTISIGRMRRGVCWPANCAA